MFHLFNKTYIDIDAFINMNIDRIVISKTNGVPLLAVLNQMYAGRLFGYGKTLSDIVGPDKQFPTLLDMLKFCFDYNKSTNKRIVIYCDREAHMELTSAWFKNIFVNIDSDSAYRIVQAYFAKEILVSQRDVTDLQDHYKVFAIQRDEFTTVFNATVDNPLDDGLLNEITGYRSVEYLLASYIYNGSHMEELKNRTYDMIVRHTEEHLKETWRSIQINIMKQSWQEMLYTKTYTLDNILEIDQDPQLQALKNTNAWRAYAGVSELPREQMNITGYSDAEINQIKSQVNKTYFNSPNEDTPHPSFIRKDIYIDLCRKPKDQFTEADLITVLDMELNPPDDERFYSLKDMVSINIYLADFFFEARKYGRNATLAPYLLK